MNLVLCGFMGCGKSTLGKLLSKATGMPLVDTDAWIEQREGRAVTRIFAERGEAYFRAVERSAVAHAAASSGAVIATGGGVPLDPDNVWRLTSSGVVFFIDVPADELWSRLAGSRERPLARGFQSREDVAAKLATRASAYAALPERVDAGVRTPQELAREILERFRARARR